MPKLQSRICRSIAVVVAVSALGALNVRADAPGSSSAPDAVQAGHVAVVAGHPIASKLGLDVLNHGGSAADALVTVCASLGVVEPGNSGLGGKLVMLYYDAQTKQVTRIVALGESPKDVDVAALNAIPAGDRDRGARVACTPGQVAGLAEAHRRFGRKPWAELIAPAAALADEGFVLSSRDAEIWSEFPVGKDADADAIYAVQGRNVKAGERMRNLDLAATLRALASGGPESFYHGAIAKKIADGVHAKGGWISEDDLAQYHARVLEPVSVSSDGLTLYSSPPPLTGGTTVLATFAALEGHDWSKGTPRDAAYIDSVGRVMQQIYRLTTRGIGDTPTAMAEAKKILEPASTRHIAEMAAQADVAHPYKGAPTQPATSIKPVDSLATSVPPADLALAFDGSALDDTDAASTTHLIIVDREGDIACVTTSLGSHFGSATVPAGSGILLNNDVNNFSLTSKSSVNYLRPRMFPRSTMAPTIALRDGKPVLAIGSPGGGRIPVMIVQVMLDVLELHRPLAEAVHSPRFHLRRATTSTEGANVIDVEPGFDPKVVEQLRSMGWDPKARQTEGFYFGAVNSVGFNADGTMTVVADPRRAADAEGN